MMISSPPARPPLRWREASRSISLPRYRLRRSPGIRSRSTRPRLTYAYNVSGLTPRARAASSADSQVDAISRPYIDAINLDGIDRLRQHCGEEGGPLMGTTTVAEVMTAPAL